MYLSGCLQLNYKMAAMRMVSALPRPSVDSSAATTITMSPLLTKLSVLACSTTYTYTIYYSEGGLLILYRYAYYIMTY